MVDPDLQRRWRFMLEHAGYASPPGRAACALELAKAEQRLAMLLDRGLAHVEWYDDDDADHSWQERDGCPDCGLGVCERHWRPLYGCLVSVAGSHASGAREASLWGIDAAPPDPYCRVVEAGLASEALHDLDAQQLEQSGAELAATLETGGYLR